uniref:Peptidase S1 domain-containing protein n=1 Tax=Anopheles farauti TaxID=69004 RepID=A0A182Q0D7_9DIPT
MIETISACLFFTECLEYQNIVIHTQVIVPLTMTPTLIEFSSHNCSKVVQLIVGGEEAKYGEFPHHALLGYQKTGARWDYEFQCGGSLISEQHVLTAAHCFTWEIDPTIVRLGVYNTAIETGREYDIDIESYRKHPAYSSGRSYNDVAVVKLKHAITFTNQIRPACLWRTQTDPSFQYLATGFGKNDSFSSTLSTVMMKVELKEFQASDCNRAFKGARQLRRGMDEGQLCVGSEAGEGRDTCQGDSGGPLQILTGPKTCTYSIVGITSIGGPCGIGVSKAIYTNVSHYVGWIEDNVWVQRLLPSSEIVWVIGKVSVKVTTMIVSYRKASWIRMMFALSWCVHVVQGQQLAAEKCQEYQNIVSSNHTIIPLTMTPVTIEFATHNCSNVVQMIVGGEEAKYGEFPHHALLGYLKTGSKWDYEFRCGGSLISEQHVLTAAHCFATAIPDVVRLGEYDTTENTGREYDADIDTYRRHPEFKNSRSYHDIALVKLKHAITFSSYIRPACLWSMDHRSTTKFIATGFGHTETAGTLSTVMRKVQLDEFPTDDCRLLFHNNRRFRTGIDEGQLCVGSLLGGRDTCQGDSGGPLQVMTNGTTCSYSVVGVTSEGKACGVGQSKAIYTKVSHYIGWIEDNVWGADAL